MMANWIYHFLHYNLDRGLLHHQFLFREIWPFYHMRMKLGVFHLFDFITTDQHLFINLPYSAIIHRFDLLRRLLRLHRRLQRKPRRLLRRVVRIRAQKLLGSCHGKTNVILVLIHIECVLHLCLLIIVITCSIQFLLLLHLLLFVLLLQINDQRG